MDIDHLSYSSISTYQRCPRKWKFRYIEKIPTLSSAPLAFGGAFHNTIEDYLIAGGDLRDHWQTRWTEKNEEEGVSFDPEEMDALFQQGLEMLASPSIAEGLTQIKPMWIGDQPMIEQKVSLEVENVPVPVIGYVDVITEDHLPGDFKTSSRKWSISKAENEIQPLFYLAALEQSGMTLPEWTFRHYVFTKANYEFQQLDSHFHPRQQEWLHQMVQNVWRGIENEVFFENPMSDWACSKNYCEYWTLCRGKYE
ncbi:MAG: PD-(D/E)XK nuclease family protein [Anaerolineae bacterium]|jgi:hypothetical protein|nr:PD-(D/E)XK nuclease family protein [Anaerolineae bacterium]